MTCLHRPCDYIFVAETPALHASPPVAAFISEEIARPSKQWIVHILNGHQEKEAVRCAHEDFLLLPDTERINRYNKVGAGQTRYNRRILNWLAIARDMGLRTLRDLRGRHVPMLQAMLQTCMAHIKKETGIQPEQVMAYIHYPPSVYQLHVHFSYPYGQYCHRDAYRVHNLSNIIDNLLLDPEYYTRATLHIPVHRQSAHFLALTQSPGNKGDEGTDENLQDT